MSRCLIVAAMFYDEIARELIAGAAETMDAASVPYDIVEVPGAFEVPAAIAFAMASGHYDGYVALGCVLRGETTHYDYVAGESARALMELSTARQAAIGYGILTCETHEQAVRRAKRPQGNKGGAAAAACLRMLDIQRQMAGTTVL